LKHVIAEGFTNKAEVAEEAYNELNSEGNSELVWKAIEFTGILPSQDILKLHYQRAIRLANLELAEQWDAVIM
jgi:hypothetical protein